ncbi:MAG: hypothetical protein KGD58_03325 [Candidatus Lokiarchaeota archaeon]|nr:hypothetical protein [Candidatus Lokiarchaeota archaeon]
MSYIKIEFDDIVFDREVYSYCVNDKFACPNYNHSYSCPPAATFLRDHVSQFKEFYLIYSKHDLDAYVKKVKEKHPRRSEQRIRNSFFLKSSYDEIYEEISRSLDNYKKQYKEYLVIWPAKCNICDNKEDRGCTYNSGEPCKYPEKFQHSMTGAGINTNETVSRLNIELEWPPIRYAYRFSLVCFK